MNPNRSDIDRIWLKETFLDLGFEAVRWKIGRGQVFVVVEKDGEEHTVVFSTVALEFRDRDIVAAALVRALPEPPLPVVPEVTLVLERVEDVVLEQLTRAGVGLNERRLTAREKLVMHALVKVLLQELSERVRAAIDEAASDTLTRARGATPPRRR